MSIQNLSFCEVRRHKKVFKDTLNASFSAIDSPLKAHLNKSVRGLFASFGLTPPPSVCNGSRDALWFSTKFEKKMAALDDDTPSSPLTRFQRAVPLRQSKLTSGPFRATQIWNEVIEHLKVKVELKKRRYKLRNYEDCFTGTDAVDVVLHYLLSDQDSFCNLSREKAVKLCQTLMDKKVFQPVGSKLGENVRHQFDDSSSKLYHFVGEHSISKENDLPDQSDSEDETEGRDETCEHVVGEGDESMSYTLPEHLRLNPDTDTEMMNGREVLCTPLNSDRLTDQTNSDVLESRKRKNQVLDTSQRKSKRQKTCTSSTESLNEEDLSELQIQDIWKEVALCQLLTKVDLSFLDGVLTEEKDKSTKKLLKPSCHSSGVVSNIVAKHWSMRCSARSASHTDPFMKAALEVIAHIPRGISKFDTDFTKSSDPVTKLQAYNMICEHYSGKLDALIPERFLDLNVAIMQLILSERLNAALHAMQLNMVLLPGRQKAELQRLLKFMSAVVLEQDLILDPQRVSNNECVVLNHLTDSVIKHKGLAWSYSSVIVQFLVHHASTVFEVPTGLREKVDARIKEVKNGNIPIVKETVFCSQVPVSEYQKLTEECTNSSLVQMMNTIIDNPKLALKEKKQRLRQFRKYHPHIYSKHFTGMVEEK